MGFSEKHPGAHLRRALGHDQGVNDSNGVAMTSIPTQDLSGKTALITGASRGIGRAIAIGYAQAGADVAVLARSAQDLKLLAEEVEGLGRRCLPLQVDVTDRREAKTAVESAISEFGHLDILVNNAGVVGAYGPFLDLKLEDWDLAMETNLQAAITFTRLAGAHMVARGSGTVVNIASMFGVIGAPMLTHYAVTKAAWCH